MEMTEIELIIRQKSESANLDYKAGFEWKKDNRDKQLELLRDIIAFANTQDGGRIVFGVEDGSYELIGVPGQILESLDQTDIGQMLHAYSQPKVSFEVQKAKFEGKDIVVIQIAEFEDVPIVCTQTLCGKDPTKPILRQAALYIRTGAAQTKEISSDQEMRELLSRAMLKRGDELLRVIERLIKGKPNAPSEQTVNQYLAELSEADKWFTQVLQKGFLAGARWEVIAYPTQYRPDRIVELPALAQLIKESQVSLRGWPFPYVGNRSETSLFNSGYQGFVDWNDIRECFRLYKSGLFVWKRAVSEDLRETKTQSGKRTLSFISAIYSVTEFVLFLKRLYESLGSVEHVRITVRLTGCKERVLASFDAAVSLLGQYQSWEDQVAFEQDFKVVELRAGAQEIALRIVKHIFHVFNWVDVTDETIAHWQNELLKLLK